jgi:hypothetical protein
MKLRHVRAKDVDADASTHASESALGLDDWKADWPEDDTPPADDRAGDVPMFLNPNSPNIGPG